MKKFFVCLLVLGLVFTGNFCQGAFAFGGDETEIMEVGLAPDDIYACESYSNKIRKMLHNYNHKFNQIKHLKDTHKFLSLLEILIKEFHEGLSKLKSDMDKITCLNSPVLDELYYDPDSKLNALYMHLYHTYIRLIEVNNLTDNLGDKYSEPDRNESDILPGAEGDDLI